MQEQFCINYISVGNMEALDFNEQEFDLEKDTLLLHGLTDPDIKILENEKVITIKCNPFEVMKQDKSLIDINIELPKGQYALHEYKDKKISIVLYLDPEKDKYIVQQLVQVTKNTIFVFRFEEKLSYINIFNINPENKSVSHDYIEFTYVGNPLNMLILPKRIEYSDGTKEELEIYKNSEDEDCIVYLYSTPIIIVDNELKYVNPAEYLISFINYIDGCEIHYSTNHI